MALTIKRGGIKLMDVNPDVTCYLQKQRNAINFATVNFTQITTNPIDLLLDDSVDIDGETYYLIDKLPEIRKVADRKHIFSCIFEAEHYKLKRSKYYSIDNSGLVLEKDFSLMGDLSAFASLLILNLNRDNPGVWKLGAVDVTETKLLSISNQNCLEAANYFVDQFQTEFWVNGHTLNFTNKAKVNGLSVAYGEGNGLYEIKRTNESDVAPVTRLRVYGGSRNLPAGYRNYSQKLQLSAPFELTPSPNNPPLNEENIEFPDVYPQFTGTVSDVTDEFTFECIDIPFNINTQLIAGTTAKVIFQTGALAGYEIEISSFDNATKIFIINTVETEQSLTVPSPTMMPAVGDLFIIVDIIMDNSFVTAAEALLYTLGLDYFNRNNFYKARYTVVPDPLFFQKLTKKFSEGDLVQTTDASLNLNRLIPIESFKKLYVVNRVNELELSDYPIVDLATRLLRKQISQANQIKQPGAIQSPRAFSFERVEQFTKNDCGGTMQGTQVTFRRKYTSSVSKANAQAIGLADTSYNADGQAFANDPVNGATCIVGKQISQITITNITRAGKDAAITISSDMAPDRNITVNVEVYGDVTGLTSAATLTLTSGNATASGTTTDGLFISQDNLSATIVAISPSEDNTYQFRG